MKPRCLVFVNALNLLFFTINNLKTIFSLTIFKRKYNITDIFIETNSNFVLLGIICGEYMVFYVNFSCI